MATRELLMARVKRLSAALDRMREGAYGTAWSVATRSRRRDSAPHPRCRRASAARTASSVWVASWIGVDTACSTPAKPGDGRGEPGVHSRAIPPERRRPRCAGSRHVEIRGQLLSDLGGSKRSQRGPQTLAVVMDRSSVLNQFVVGMVVLGLLGSGVLVGCEKGPAEKLGEKLDRALDKLSGKGPLEKAGVADRPGRRHTQEEVAAARGRPAPERGGERDERGRGQCHDGRGGCVMVTDAGPLACDSHIAGCGGNYVDSLCAQRRDPAPRAGGLLRLSAGATSGVCVPSVHRAKARAVMPRALAIGVVYLLILGALALAAALLLPRVGTQITQFAQEAPSYLDLARSRALGWTTSYEEYRLPAAVRDAINKSATRTVEIAGTYVTEGSAISSSNCSGFSRGSC